MEKLLRARYPQEFKLQAVSMVIDEGLGITETAGKCPAVSSSCLFF